MKKIFAGIFQNIFYTLFYRPTSYDIFAAQYCKIFLIYFAVRVKISNFATIIVHTATTDLYTRYIKALKKNGIINA